MTRSVYDLQWYFLRSQRLANSGTSARLRGSSLRSE